MRILMVLENQFPDDERVEKEALSLIKAGHEVHLLCATLKKERVWFFDSVVCKHSLPYLTVIFQ